MNLLEKRRNLNERLQLNMRWIMNISNPKNICIQNLILRERFRDKKLRDFVVAINNIATEFNQNYSYIALEDQLIPYSVVNADMYYQRMILQTRNKQLAEDASKVLLLLRQLQNILQHAKDWRDFGWHLGM